MLIVKDIGGRVRAARNDFGLSQTDLARLAGVSRRTIVRLERSEADVRLSCIEAIDDALRKLAAERS